MSTSGIGTTLSVFIQLIAKCNNYLQKFRTIHTYIPLEFVSLNVCTISIVQEINLDVSEHQRKSI
jgi:hypothetical protein